MKAIILDGSMMTTRESAHMEIAQKLGFPAYYGNNLDALWDLLVTADETSVTMIHVDAMLDSLREYGCRLLLTFFEAEQENPLLHFTLPQA